MPKFVVVELNDDVSTIDLLSYCVKRNYDRVSLLQRLEDHPYLRDDTDVHEDHSPQSQVGSSHFNLTEDERNKLLKLIGGGGQTLTALDRVQMPHPTTQAQHMGVPQQHQMPSTSTFSSNSFMYQQIKTDNNQYTALKTEAQQQQQAFEATVNSVAHAQQIDDMQMQQMDAIRELFPTNNGQSPAGGEVLRRKQAQRRPEESCKATCKVCGHDVMYSPQRTWNLMRHVWIMHQSSKPNQCSLCGYSHIKPYVRKHIETHHKNLNATILDLKSPELEAEWSSLLDQCFGVTYRKWKHHKDETQTGGVVVAEDHSAPFRQQQDHFQAHQQDVMTNL